MSTLDQKIKELRKIAEATDSDSNARSAARSILDGCKARDRMRNKLGLKPIFGAALTLRKNVTTYDAVAQADAINEFRGVK